MTVQNVPKLVEQMLLVFKYCLALRVIEALPTQTRTSCAQILELKLQIRVAAEELGGDYDSIMVIFDKHTDSVSADAEQFYAAAGKAAAAMESPSFVVPPSSSVH